MSIVLRALSTSLDGSENNSATARENQTDQAWRDTHHDDLQQHRACCSLAGRRDWPGQGEPAPQLRPRPYQPGVGTRFDLVCTHQNL